MGQFSFLSRYIIVTLLSTTLQKLDSHLFVVPIYENGDQKLKPCRYETSQNKAPILAISKFWINNSYTREPVKDFNNQLYHVITLYSTVGTISTYSAGEPLESAQDQLVRLIALANHISSLGFPKIWKIKEVSITEQDIKSELDGMSEDIIIAKQVEGNNNGTLNTSARISLYCYLPALAGILIVSCFVLIIDSVPAKGRKKNYDITITDHKP
uniref:SEA domain-containing protein n=1 Tax=Bursaphelenchus xylophilus TaxID=6326 RepID=A0A1I7S967_BURXY